MTTLIVILQAVTLIGLAAAALFIKHYLPSYMTEKGKNLATKEDIEDITHKVESIKQIHARQLELVRSSLAIAAKRKERFHDKQATVLATTYQRLSASTDGVLRLLVPMQSPEERQEHIIKSAKTLRKLRDYSAMNKLYIPDELATHISDVTDELFIAQATLAAAADPDSVWKKRDESIERAERILNDLRTRFRTLMLGDDLP